MLLKKELTVSFTNWFTPIPLSITFAHPVGTAIQMKSLIAFIHYTVIESGWTIIRDDISIGRRL